MKNLWTEIESTADAVCAGVRFLFCKLATESIARSGTGKPCREWMKLGTDRFTWPRLAVVLFSLAYSGSSATGERYEVEGDLTCSFTGRQGYPASATISHFRVSVLGCRWFVRLTPENKEEGDYQEVAYDGAQSYYVNNFATRIRIRRAKSEKVGFNDATAWMYKGSAYNIEFAREVGPLWLCYASGCHFAELRTNAMEPVVSMGVGGGRYSPENPFVQRIHWTPQVELPHLPQHVVFLDDGLVRLSADVTVQRGKPLDVGFTNAVFQVLRYTNVGKMRLPMEARVSVYGPDPNGPKAKVVSLLYEYSIRLSCANTDVSVAVFQPVLPDKTYLTDGRIKELQPLGLGAVRAWPSEDFVKQTEEYKQAVLVKRAPRHFVRPPQPRTSAIRFALLAMLGGSTLVVGYLAYKKFSGQSHNQ